MSLEYSIEDSGRCLKGCLCGKIYPAKVDLYYTHRDLDSLSLVEVDSQLRESKFYGQATKGARWMPWQKQAMKDVASCDKLRGAAHRR